MTDRANERPPETAHDDRGRKRRARKIRKIPIFPALSLPPGSLATALSILLFFPLAGIGGGPQAADGSGAASLLAQSPAEAPALANDTLDAVEMEELVVTAYRLPVSRDALTGSVTVIHREEIEESGADHVLELLRNVPGAHVVQSGAWGEPASLFMRGGESNYVRVLVDGVPVNRAGGDFDFSTLTTEGIERIEVVRGPTSVLYGSDAVTGVVQIFTRRGEGPPSVTARATGGTFGSRDWSGGLSGGTETISYSASVSRFSTDGTRPFNDDYRNSTASAMVRARPDVRTDARVSLRYTDHRSHFPTDGAGRLADENQFRFGEELTLSVEAARFLTERLEARLLLGHTNVNSGFDDQPDGPADTTGVFRFESLTDFSRDRADLRLNYHLGETAVFTGGVEWEGQDEQTFSLTESEFGEDVSTRASDRRNLGYYAQVVSEPMEGLAVNAGARLDDNQEFGTFDTYRVGAAYRIAVETRVRASFATGFKEPTFIENFGTDFVVGNPDLDPERSTSWEAGLEQTFLDGRLALEAVFFHQSFRDLVQFTPAPPEPGAPNFFNVAEANSRGVELEADARLPGGLRLGAGYTYLDTEVLDAGFDAGEDATFVEGDRLLRRPTHAVSASLAWRGLDRASLRVQGQYVGARDDRDFSTFPAARVELPSHVRVDATLRVTALDRADGLPSLIPILRVENLLDRDYEEVVNFPARGRTIFAGAEVGFQI